MTDDIQNRMKEALGTMPSDIVPLRTDDPWTCILPVPESVLAPGEMPKLEKEGKAPQHSWAYHDAEGRLLGIACRWNKPDGGKDFRFFTWCRNAAGKVEWRAKHLPEPRALYGLDQLAAKPDASVVIVEGEKTTEAARRVFPASVVVTSPGGAHAAGKADWSVLAGRPRVLIVPDADEAGYRYARDVAKRLAELNIPDIQIAETISLEHANRHPTPQGWDIADALEDGWTLDALRKALCDSAKPFERHISAPSEVNGVKWPPGFEMTPHGLLRNSLKDAPPELICGAFELLDEVRDPDNGSWALRLAWQDRDGVPHEGLIARADLLGDGVEVFKPLAAKGLAVPHALSKIRALKSALMGVQCPTRARIVHKTGWHNHVFVLPSKTFGVSGENIVYPSKSEIARYGTAGTLDEWREAIAAPASGNSRLILALSLAFAGPLADLLQEEPGGVHFVGGSSIGKSTALYAAGSVWGGGGRNGFAQTWRATGNGLEGIAKAHSGTCLILDEMGELDAREAGAVAYALVNGEGKARALRNGEARQRAEWRCMILSSGEVSLADKIEETGRKAKQGQLVRFIDIPADAGAGLGLFENTHGQSPAAFASAIKEASLRLFGVAGETFLNALVEAREESERAARDGIKARCAQWIGDDANGQVHRVARRFALIATAGELACVALELPWSANDILWSAQTCFEAWRSERGDEGAGEITAALSALREIIERHGESRFIQLTDEGCKSGFPIVRDALGYRFRHGERHIWGFTPSGWREAMKGIASPAWIARELAVLEFLMVTPSETARHQLSKKVEGKRMRLYAVLADKLFGEDDK